MPINVFSELKKYEDISYADPSGRKVGGGTRPPRPTLIDAMLCLCRTYQSNILAKKFVITQMGMLHKVQESAASTLGDQHQAGEG